MPRGCPCGGICKGNAHRCAFNVRLQAQRARRRGRAELKLVPETKDPIVFLQVYFDDGSTCLLTATQLLELPREYFKAITGSEFVSIERAPLLVQP